VIQFPSDYLPVQSRQWVRAVNDRLNALDTVVAQADVSLSNMLAQAASTLAGLGESVRALITVQSMIVTSTSFNVTTSYANKAFATLPVPDGATTAIVLAAGYVRAMRANPGPATDPAILFRTAITGVGNSQEILGQQIGAAASNPISGVTMLTGIIASPPAGGINIGAQARCYDAGYYATNASNTASINAVGMFLR
jgi:hypothetical protein